MASPVRSTFSPAPVNLSTPERLERELASLYLAEEGKSVGRPAHGAGGHLPRWEPPPANRRATLYYGEGHMATVDAELVWDHNEYFIQWKSLTKGEVSQIERKAEIVVNTKWLVAVFYAALNSYTWQHVPYMRALLFLNQVCFPAKASTTSLDNGLDLVCENFINQAFASTLQYNDTFPLFDLTAVQQRDSPFSQFLESSASFQKVALLYRNMIDVLSISIEASMSPASKKTSLSAVLLNPTKTLIHGIEGTFISKVEEGSSSDSEEA